MGMLPRTGAKSNCGSLAINYTRLTAAILGPPHRDPLTAAHGACPTPELPLEAMTTLLRRCPNTTRLRGAGAAPPAAVQEKRKLCSSPLFERAIFATGLCQREAIP